MASLITTLWQGVRYRGGIGHWAYQFHRVAGLATLLFLGVHILGEGATELIHIGQAVLNLGGTLDYFVENAFNYPTLAETYKIAALDAFNRMPNS